MNPQHVPDFPPDLPPDVPLRLRDRAWWPWLTRGVLVVFGAFVLGLLIWQGTRVDWPAVFAAMAATPNPKVSGIETPPDATASDPAAQAAAMAAGILAAYRVKA